MSKSVGSHPFRFGFVATLGVLLALLLGAAIASLSTALTLIFVSFFVCLGIQPAVTGLERRGFTRVTSLLTVLGAFILLAVGIGWLILPIVTEAMTQLAEYVPTGLSRITEQGWFQTVDEASDGGLLNLVQALKDATADPSTWTVVGGGVLRVGTGLVNGTFSAVFVLVLSVYFVASLESIKANLYLLVPRSRRTTFVEVAETIMASVGTYLGGMAVLAAMNAIFTFLLLSLAGIPFAPVLAILAFPITLIPLVGSVINLIIISTVSLFSSPTTALIVFILMLIYVQVESYVLTPRIVSKAIKIPGTLVLIGALIGGTLLGLLGALIACPTTAAILLIVRRFVIPRQELV